MNKLSIALAVISAKKWSNILSPEMFKEFEYLAEASKDLTDEELNEADWNLIAYVDELLAAHADEDAN